MPRAMKESRAEISKKVRKSLRYSIYDGAFASMMVGFGESFFSAFAIFLKASSIQLGLLGSLPQALGSASQIFSNGLLKKVKSRRKIVYTGALLQALVLIPIMLVFFLSDIGVYYLIFFVSLYWIFGSVLGPSWTSWMGDLVRKEERGSYFGRRTKIAGLASFVSLLVAGLILQVFTDGVMSHFMGFVIIFGLAFVSRLLSAAFLMKKYEPPYKAASNAEFGFSDFVRQARFRNYGRFALYLCAMNFAVYLSAPFFAAYMLYDLRMDYLTFTVINASALVVKYIAMPIWGKASDRYGTRKVLSLSGFLMPLVPFLWLFSADFLYLIAIQVYSGFVWAGFEIASFNFIFDTTTSQKRATCVAYYNVLNGFAIFFGGLLGGVVVRYGGFFWSNYLFVFLLSAALRYSASAIFVPKLKEVREVEHIPYRRLFFNIVRAMPVMSYTNNTTMSSRKRNAEK